MRALVLAGLVLASACAEERAPAATPAPADPAPAAAPADALVEDTAAWKEVQVRVLGMH